MVQQRNYQKLAALQTRCNAAILFSLWSFQFPPTKHQHVLMYHSSSPLALSSIIYASSGRETIAAQTNATCFLARQISLNGKQKKAHPYGCAQFSQFTFRRITCEQQCQQQQCRQQRCQQQRCQQR